MFRYLLLRTRRDIATHENEICALADAIGSPDAYQPSEDEDVEPWRNGLALRIADDRALNEIAASLKAELAPFENWTLCDGKGSVEEKYHGGPARMFLDETKNASSRERIALIYLSFIQTGRDPDNLTDQVISALSVPARAVFHLDDGRILMARTDQPLSLIPRRLEQLRNLLSFVAVCGWNGEAVNAGKRRPEIWDSFWESA